MSSGTITVTNKSDKVVGVGTAFTTDLKAGDVMVMPVGTGSFTLIVKSIESATGLTLMDPFRGPTLSGQSWSAVPYETMLRINAQLSTQTGVAIYGLNMDKQNWQAVFSESGDITVILPDQTTFKGPSWKKIADLLDDLDPVHLDTVAAQIHADAQLVATDKASAAASATTATQKATAAAGSATTAADSATTATQKATAAEGSATNAAASATAAANSAASVHPENLLQKSNNLSELTDKIAARTNLGVYSKAETDAKAGATNARIGYALLSVNNPALNSRTVIANPFGNSVQVECECEIFHATLQKWTTTPWIYVSGSGGIGIIAAYSEGEGIILRCGPVGFVSSAANSGCSQPLTDFYTTPSPVRIHVRKITA